jgi:hypothetical protein
MRSDENRWDPVDSRTKKKKEIFQIITKSSSGFSYNKFYLDTARRE